MEKIIKDSLRSHNQALDILSKNQASIEKIASLCVGSLKNKGKIIFMGNGGSAADAQHLAAELVGRFKKERPAMASIALTVNTSCLTAIGNDYGFDEVFSRQIEALAQPQDLVVGISTSGNSPNIIKAIEKAKQMGIKTVCLLGKDGGKLKKIADDSLVISLTDTPRVQEMHILAGHIICEIIENSQT